MNPFNLIQQIGCNLAAVACDEMIKNPYLKSGLSPLINMFVGGVLNPASLQTLPQSHVGPWQEMMNQATITPQNKKI